VTTGVETTTGPLGQGLANAVGMAIAEKLLNSYFNRDGFNIIDHYTYVCVGDGCLMEGISHEVCSLSGTLGLGKLIVIYDDNGISIDGEVQNWFNEDVAKRFQAYNFQVIGPIDGHDVGAIRDAINLAKSDLNHPSLIICKTIIGKGAPKRGGSAIAHGAPLGKEEIKLLRQELKWEHPPFVIPKEVYEQFDHKTKGQQTEEEWLKLFNQYEAKYPELAYEFKRRINRELPSDFEEIMQEGVLTAIGKTENMATRKASKMALDYYAQFLPELIGGSADLTESNLTHWNNAVTLGFNNNFTGNYISYGVREFGMSAILSGIYLHRGLRPFGGTFLMFSEYARNALRMAALMRIAPIFVYTHDSIGLGEDGPTHQPIEQLATLRLIPNMIEWRPCDIVETFVAWGMALRSKFTPVSLIFSRQALPRIPRNNEQIQNIKQGGYVLRHNLINEEIPQVLIIATGSEVSSALFVYEKLIALNYKVQLVSMPSTTTFDLQTKEYKDYVLPNSQYKIVIELGVVDSWYKYVGRESLIIGLNRFGESGKIEDLLEYFGFTQEQIWQKTANFIGITNA
jgi:transketolase